MTDIQEIMETMSFFEDWEDKYSYIIDLGNSLPLIAESDKTDENKISGCISQVWITHGLNNGKCEFKADSDSHIVKGLASIVLSVINGKDAAEVASYDFKALFAELELDQYLSPNRRGGLYSMVKHVQDTCKAVV